MSSSISGAKTGNVSLLNLATSGQVYEFELPEGTRSFKVKLRSDAVAWSISFGEEEGDFVENAAGDSWSEVHLDTRKGQKLFIKAASNSQIAEISYWK